MIHTVKRTSVLFLFTFLTTAMLLQSEKAVALALNGLNLWFQRMIPTLLPFMILSGILIRMDLSDRFAKLFAPLLGPLFRLSDSCIYIIVIGFLCGFPMGARVTAESLRHGKISAREASLMLAFCNNIGPIYFTGYVLKLFPAENIWFSLAGMYLIPFGYGLVLRYTVFWDIPVPGSIRKILHAASFRDNGFAEASMSASAQGIPPTQAVQNKTCSTSLLPAIQDSIMSSLVSQAALGGYMILFNLLNLLPELLLPARFGTLKVFCGCLLEITGGLAGLPREQALWSFVFLQFGGLSCIAQTYSMIEGTELSLPEYVKHKAVQMLLAFCYFSFLY